MSYDPSGIYNLPPVYKAEPGTTIRSEQHNSPLEDIAQALSFVLVRDGRAGMVGNLPMGGYRAVNMAAGTNVTDAATVGQLVPIGTIVDYALSTAPEGWTFCYGQALTSSTPYPLLRAALLAAGSPFGTSGSDPRVPDYRGRVGAGKDNMGGTSANRLTNQSGGVNGDVLGDTGGAETHTLSVGQMPSHNHSGSTGSGGNHTHTMDVKNLSAGSGGNPVTGTPSGTIDSTYQSDPSGSHSHSIPSQGGNDPHNNVQPTIIVNKIIKAAY
ncbi:MULTISPECIES: phage tail protein [Chelativorans]|jgi:microcystin-dependent protein|uniref:phage tail protein n=1 Tax=Chelativorans TaxID=449972 RepID=UPI00140A3028|nr:MULTISPECIES: tail fiber protein [Chelativorans]